MESRSEYLPESRKKIQSPFELDPEMTFYCPQENVEALELPQVRSFHDHLTSDYEPPEPVQSHASVLLMYPCTKTKPYPLSQEHRLINQHLLETGWEPVEDPGIPEGLTDHLSEEFDPELLRTGPLRKGDRVIHRAVLSEPMGIVPYELIYSFKGEPSPVSRYDDPGLFEHRGNTVCFWREDATGVKQDNGKWRWGPRERGAFAEIHNLLVDHIADVLDRLDEHYEELIGYVSPKMTHRSFLTSQEEKRAQDLPLSKQTDEGRIQLKGINDRREDPVEIVPDEQEISELLGWLKERLEDEKDEEVSDRAVKGYYSTAGGKATPLVLPETLRVLDRYLTG